MKKELKYIILIILSSLLSAIAVQGFVEPAHLYPAGFLGLSVFISNILSSFLHMNLSVQSYLSDFKPIIYIFSITGSRKKINHLFSLTIFISKFIYFYNPKIYVSR